MLLDISSVWPEWEIIEKIGEGSFGKVYKAKREEHNSTFYSAIKMITIPQNEEIREISSEGIDEQGSRTYFRGMVDDCIEEIRIMEFLKGTPNIISVEDYKVVEHAEGVGWDIFIRMELLTSFIDYIKVNLMDEKEVIRLGLDLCNALEYCAKMDLIHRDIKPENIFVSKFHDFKIGDFGIARQLSTNFGNMSRKGTYNYMAPEVYRGQDYDARADIYSLGIVLYKLMNDNRIPFLDTPLSSIRHQDWERAFTRRLSGERLPPPAQASPGMARAILTACQFRKEDRYADATAFKNALLMAKQRKMPDQIVTAQAPDHMAAPRMPDHIATPRMPDHIVTPQEPVETKTNSALVLLISVAGTLGIIAIILLILVATRV